MLKKPAASFWLNAMFYTLLQRVSLFVFGAVAYMILVRGFSTQLNGIWALYITLFSLFESAKQGLLRNATIKFLGMARYADKKAAVQSASFFLNVVFSFLAILAIAIAGGLVAQWLHAPSLFPLLLWSTLMICLLIPFSHCETILQSKFRFDVLFRCAFIRQGIFFCGLVVLFLFFRTSFTLLNVLFIQTAALSIALIYMLTQGAKEVTRKYVYDRELIGRLFHFGKYTFGTNLFSGLSRNFDHFITAGLLDPFQGKNYVAYYHTVGRINNMVDIPALAAADVLYPKNVETIEKEGIVKVKRHFEQMAGSLLAILLPVSLFIILFPRLILHIIAGPAYYSAAVILQLTILFSIVRPISYQFGSTLDAIGKPHINFRANLLLMGVNLGLTSLAIVLYGGIGAAYASMLTYTLSLLIMLYLLKKYVNVGMQNILAAAVARYREIFRYLFRRGSRRRTL